METSRGQRLAAFGVASLLTGCAVGGVSELISTAATYPESQQIAEIAACAAHLGPVAVSSETIPASCNPISPRDVPYHYNQAGNVVYSLPSAKHLLLEKKLVPAQIQAQDRLDLKVSEVAGVASAVGTFGLFAFLDKVTRPARRIPHLKLVK
jgi:hypothetical protein